MTFNPHTHQDRAEMMQTIGITEFDQLVGAIPESVRYPNLDLPRLLTEMEAAARLSDLAERNLAPKPGNTYLGAGSYQHFIPATVNQILSRGEFYTAYTPYQPEVSQGTLQVIYEFQSMVAALLGTEIANASMYDGATALAEGALMAVSASKKRNRLVVAGSVHPGYREVLRTYLSSGQIELIELPVPTTGFANRPEDFAPYLTDDLAGIVIQYPNFFGAIEDVRAVADAVHAAGANLIVATYPMPLGLLKPPGELGADIVAAEGQALGVAQSYGGPYVGLLASRKSFVRQMPGRLAGQTTDSEGKRGFVLTLQTREQHIRREKATSNICTNQGLMATAATVYMASLGPEGFREAARRCYHNAHYLAQQLASLPGWELGLDDAFFHEFVVKAPEPAKDVNAKLLTAGIIGGFDLGVVDPTLDQHLLMCATETNDRAGIDRLISILAA